MSSVKPWRIVVTFALVFVAGFTAGMVLAKVHSQRAFERSLQHETWIAETMEKLDQEVTLTPEQRAKILPLVEAGAKQVRANIVSMATNSALLIDRLGGDIDRELTPEQRTTHGRMREEFRQRMREALRMEFPGTRTNAPAFGAPTGPTER